MFENRLILAQLHPWYFKAVMFLGFVGAVLLIPIIEAQLRTATTLPYDWLYKPITYLAGYLLAIFIFPEVGAIVVRKVTEPK